MPTLLQINVTANWGSTGKIAEQIGQVVMAHGWESYIAYGRMMNPSKSKLIKIGTKFDVYEHYAENLILDNEGLASRRSTKRFLKKLDLIKPDIVHLHNIHDHYINYRYLLRYLIDNKIPIVWTFHDFWPVTGHCPHFIKGNCYKWQKECYECALSKSWVDRSNRNFYYKKSLLQNIKNLHVVCVSDWVSSVVKESFLANHDIRVVSNGIDLSIFKPSESKQIQHLYRDKYVILAVASQWKEGKGLNDYLAMSQLIKEDEVIVLVGVDEKIKRSLPNNIIGINRTNNVQELVDLYTRADVVTSLSSAETFGLTIIESYACGTPVVAYNNTAQGSLITNATGICVDDKNYKMAYEAIQEIRKSGKAKYSKECIRFVTDRYNETYTKNQYMDLYNELLKL